MRGLPWSSPAIERAGRPTPGIFAAAGSTWATSSASDGSFDFVDRSKLRLIKSGRREHLSGRTRSSRRSTRQRRRGGQLKKDRSGAKFPLAFVSRKDETLDSTTIDAILQSTQEPRRAKSIHRVRRLPRSTTGKIQRHEMERWLRNQDVVSRREHRTRRTGSGTINLL